METNNPLLNISGTQLRRAAEIKERIDALNNELSQILQGGGKRRGRPPGTTVVAEASPRKRRRMSAEGRERIAAAARARWARVRAEKEKAARK